MNKFQKVGLAVVFALGVSFAQKTALWDVGMPGGQVQFPWIQACWEAGGDDTNSEDPCYKELGGWWFGFVAGPAQGAPICPDGRGVDGYKSTETNKVEAKINGNWVSIVGPDYPSCEGPAISDPENGNSYLLGGALEVRLTTGGGLEGPPTWDPDMAVLAVNLNTPPYAKETDMSKYAQGFYLKYESDHTADHTLQLTLGWDEGIDGVEYGYDTWFSPIKVGTGVQTQEFWWAKEAEPAGGSKLKAGDFIQEGWDDGTQGALKVAENTIHTAVTKMQAVKIELKNQTMTAQPAVNFKIIEFGFVGVPDPFGPSPIVRSKGVQNAAKFSLNGRMLSMLSSDAKAKPVAVQVINLQGALVHSQTLASGAINLSHLPAGVYIVRSPALGYSSRIMLK